jgi:hypothetical protein
MKQNLSTIAAIVIAAALTGTLSTAPVITYADESETDTEQNLDQENVGSGDAEQNNCAQNLIKAGADFNCNEGIIVCLECVGTQQTDPEIPMELPGQ